MGYPGNPKTRNLQSAMNKGDVTAYYLEAQHKDHYMLFNLAEETYDTILFHDRVMNYNLNGYPAPGLGLLVKICTGIESWLSSDPKNIAVVHCYVPHSPLPHRVGWQRSHDAGVCLRHGVDGVVPLSL